MKISAGEKKSWYEINRGSVPGQGLACPYEGLQENSQSSYQGRNQEYRRVRVTLSTEQLI